MFRNGAAPISFGDRCDPVEQLLDPRARVHLLAAAEVEQLAGEAVANRPPEVLLEQAVGQAGQWLALVERAGAPGGQAVTEGGERLRLGEVGLPVRDADLDRRVGEVRADAPPDLGVLGDRAGPVEKRDVVLPAAPVAVDVGDAAAREHPGEHLGARRVQARVDRLDEGRACRQRKHLRQEVAQGVVHGDRAVGAGDPHVHVQTEGVVPPHDVAKDLVVPPVVRRVDDALVLPAAPRVRPGAAERKLQLARDTVDLAAPLLHGGRRLAEVLAATGAHLDLRGDQLADDVRGEVGLECGGVDLLEAIRERERVRVEERELLLDGDREVGAGVEVVAALRDQLLPGDALFVAHSAQRVAVPVG